jgi:hypothetical protein
MPKTLRVLPPRSVTHVDEGNESQHGNGDRDDDFTCADDPVRTETLLHDQAFLFAPGAAFAPESRNGGR